jgi:hypothetical protein
MQSLMIHAAPSSKKLPDPSNNYSAFKRIFYALSRFHEFFIAIRKIVCLHHHFRVKNGSSDHFQRLWFSKMHEVRTISAVTHSETNVKIEKQSFSDISTAWKVYQR